tara:strand:- start:11210 stop:12580 length:1371 start_codon:yes stop_codon:yes gene_type:complete
MKILLLIYGSNDTNLNFKKFNVDNTNITQTIFLEENIKYLNELFDTFTNFDFILFISKHYAFSENLNINKYTTLLNKDYHQILFTECTSSYTLINETIIEPCYKKHNFLTHKHMQSSLTVLSNSLELNYRFKNKTGINYNEYIDNKELNWPYFKLQPSIIKTDVFKKIKDTKLSLIYPDRKFAYEYAKSFKSCHLVNPISLKVNLQEKKGTPDDMTIVTGFINIPHEGKSVKTHCKKKHKYSYLEKSIPTLNIKQKMVIYVPQNLYDHVYKYREQIGYLDKTKIIIINEEFLYFSNYIEKIRENCLKNNDIYKNPYYICAVSTRYNFVRDAIKNNFFSTNYFTWIDFGASHSITMDDNTTFYYNQKKFRISWIARYNKNKKLFKYNHYVLGGGIFGGHKDIVNYLAELHDEVFKENMELGYNCNDDKTLWYIFERYPELFDIYFSGYAPMAQKFSK